MAPNTPGTSTLRDIFAASVDSPSAARAILQTRFDERGIAVGPERDWLAYVSNESGRAEVYIRRLAPRLAALAGVTQQRRGAPLDALRRSLLSQP